MSAARMYCEYGSPTSVVTRPSEPHRNEAVSLTAVNAPTLTGWPWRLRSTMAFRGDVEYAGTANAKYEHAVATPTVAKRTKRIVSALRVGRTLTRLTTPGQSPSRADGRPAVALGGHRPAGYLSAPMNSTRACLRM